MRQKSKDSGIPLWIWITVVVFIVGEAILILSGGGSASILRQTLKRPAEIDPNRPMVALTFDDGPSGDYSARILDCLESNNAVATFFEIGENVDRYPELTKRAFEMGCEIGSHTYHHLNLRTASEEALNRDRELCENAFMNAIGAVPELLRPPEGNLGSTAKKLYPYIFIGWSVDTEDWLTRSAPYSIEKVKDFGDLDGQVILLHSLYESSAIAAENIIPWLISEGYQLVTVSDLLKYHYGITPQQGVYYSVDYFYYGHEPT